MINEDSVRVVGGSMWNHRFKRPIYDTYGFSLLPDTTTRLLTGSSPGPTLPAKALGGALRQFNKVVVILLDGFGWMFMDAALQSGKYPFLERIAKSGVLSMLSTQFPSTTTAQITTMRFGQTVGQHGLYEWSIFDPQFGELITPLRFSKAGAAVESLKSTGVDPARIYLLGQNYYQQLASLNVASYLFEPIAITSSSYNLWSSARATVFPFRTFPEALVNLGDALSRFKAPGYFYLYYDQIDGVCHKYGPNSSQVLAEIDTTLTSLERILFPLIKDQRDMAFLLTADHGQASVDPARTVFLNRELPKITHWMRRDSSGYPLKFAGSPRDVFLHILPEYVEEAETALKRLLVGKAEIYRTSELTEAGLFGPEISKRFKSRIADLVILCYENESVWWHDGKPVELKYGNHGSLDKSEAETFLGFLEF